MEEKNNALNVDEEVEEEKKTASTNQSLPMIPEQPDDDCMNALADSGPYYSNKDVLYQVVKCVDEPYLSTYSVGALTSAT